MGISHPIRKKPRTIHDANSIVSETLTQTLIDHVQKLPDYPAATYLKDQFLNKFVSKETDPASVRRQRAINKWLSVERDNEATNDRLFNTLSDFHIMPRVRWSSFVEKCCEIVADIIGETVPLDALVGSFSSGASTSRRRTESYPASKYLGKADVTTAAMAWFNIAIETIPGWSSYREESSLTVVDGNILFTVLKNTTIDRVACKEPDINMFLQKGVGNFFRTSLRKKGIDLNDQSRNKDLARKGSLDGSLATLDLSSASDSVSKALVELLLPVCWFDVLNGLRCPVTIIDGEKHVNEMFSSMGNGFTFELESLLFYCISRTCAYFRGISGVISVYGDDIICPTELSSELIFVLEYLGFSVNTEKSFVSGPFRESCGGHYHNGNDITPFYIRKPIETLTDLIHTANAVRFWSGKFGSVLDPCMEPLWLSLASQVPECFWGGHDLQSITQLASPGFPRRKLLRINSKKPVNHVGAMIHWLNITWRREGTISDSVITTDRSVDLCKYKSIRVSSMDSNHVSCLWLSEIHSR